VHILVVEDDTQLAELLERVLREEGHIVSVCGTAAAARSAVAELPLDVVVLDWMLPDQDGLTLVSHMRTVRPETAILMLTARGEVHDRVAALYTGADDYMTKPFEVEELLARLAALYRRTSRTWFTRLGRLEIDRRSQIVRVDGQRLEFTAREFALLARLADAPDECVPRPDLLKDVWKMTFDPGSGLIDVHVSRVREKLGDVSWMVETVRGRGLRLRTR
jgi:DNA-binding response OmpR family regulator